MAAAPLAFRPAVESDLPRLVEIHTSAFPDGRGFDARVRNFTQNSLGNLEDLQVALRDGVAVGHAFLFRLHVWIGGKKVQTGGVASVGVAVEERGHGVARELLGHLHTLSAERQDACTLLYPFRYGFYRALGYASTGITQHLRLVPGAVPREWSHAAEFRVRPANGSDRAAIERLHDHQGARTTGFLVRPARRWDRVFTDERNTVIVAEDNAGDVRGYATWKLEQREAHARVVLRVADLIAETASARRALVGRIGAQRDQVSQVFLDVAPDDVLAIALEDANRDLEGTEHLPHSAGTLGLGPMIRLGSVERAVEARGYAEEGAFDFEVDGAPRKLAVQGGTARLLDPTPGAEKVVFTHEGLVACFFGGMPTSRAAELGWVRCPAGYLATLDRMLKMPPFFSTDAF